VCSSDLHEKRGIPASGLFTGTNERKTVEERNQFGGNANGPLDGCYHRKCDDINNISWDAVEQLSKAGAYVLDSFAN